MSGASGEPSTFEHGAGFTPGEISGALGLGPLEAQYEELFADALADGVITADERARLEKAADNMGLDRQRLLRLEQAMLAAYQIRHKVRIIEHYEEPAASLAPIQVQAAGDAGRALLLKRIEQLEGRVAELEGELRRAQAAINVEVDLSDVEAAASRSSEDPDECWRSLRRNPTQPEPLRALYAIYSARGEQDRRWCIAQALAALGAADAEQSAFFEAHRVRALLAPRASVSASSFHEYLFHPEEELLTGQIFGVIAPAVLLGRVTALRRDRQLHQPAPDTRQDPATSTVTAVRAIAWAAAILGLPLPPVYVDKTRDVGFEHIPGVPPLTLIGQRVLSRRSPLEHAFLVGRHLSWYRSEHFIKTLFSAVPDLEDLFLAALTIGNPGLPIAEDVKRRVQPLAKAIEPVLQPGQLDTLRGHFLRFVEEGGRTNLQRWSASSEKTACRVGLLLSGDLLTARALLEQEEGELGGLMKDLIVFVASERYFTLRKQLGVTIEPR
ncbi:MAG TPA: hypothetical protein VK524_00970 [Polyangiaceae bacterium]|nr:hypothetical protein [Polyangiaceae bacterium]